MKNQTEIPDTKGKIAKGQGTEKQMVEQSAKK